LSASTGNKTANNANPQMPTGTEDSASEHSETFIDDPPDSGDEKRPHYAE